MEDAIYTTLQNWNSFWFIFYIVVGVIVIFLEALFLRYELPPIIQFIQSGLFLFLAWLGLWIGMTFMQALMILECNIIILIFRIVFIPLIFVFPVTYLTGLLLVKSQFISIYSHLIVGITILFINFIYCSFL
jgi:hypothetical protein